MSIDIRPRDRWNEALIEHVHPGAWVNPPAGEARYNLVVLGAGTAGLVAAASAAGLGAKVALIERDFMGGDCLNVGCVPSKTLLNAAREIPHDFAAAMERVRRIRAAIAPHDAAQRFRDLGVDVFFGSGRFTARDRLTVGEQDLRFVRALIATGARPAVPPLAGLDTIPYLTNESIFSLTELPQRLAIIGAGPIGCELAQSFARFGSTVHLIERDPRILAREDRDGAALIYTALRECGVDIYCDVHDLRCAPKPAQQISLTFTADDRTRDLEVDEVLVAAGRKPNIEGIGLDQAGINYTATGVAVDQHLRTSNSQIYAAGDVCSSQQFTHAADFMARTVIQNALFFGRKHHGSLVIPRCIYTCPALAHVGIAPNGSDAHGAAMNTYTVALSDVDRAVIEDKTAGFFRVHLKSGSDKILGATVCCEHAGDLIGYFSLAMTHRIGLKKFATTIFPYPTHAEAIRKLGDHYNRDRLTPRLGHYIERFMTWRRR